MLFIAYFFIAARPVPRETILVPLWLSSLDTGIPISLTNASLNNSGQSRLFPFSLGSRFGYVDGTGNKAINNVRTGGVYLSENLWTEHGAEPSVIEIKNTASETVITIEDPRGYPLILGGRVFILGSEMNALSEIGTGGDILWTYEFGAPLTCIDVAAGLVLTGTVDGIIEILDPYGSRIFFFEPGGSRYSVILGAALSSDGSKLGIVSGIDQQRFLMLERFGASGGDYRVVYHEFLDSDFRREIFISFIDNDSRIIFESNIGLTSYNVRARRTARIPLNGRIAAIDYSGDNGFFFLINSTGEQKELVGIRFPHEGRFVRSRSGRNLQDAIFMKASFTSDDIFLGRSSSALIVGGGLTLISFTLEEK